MPRDTTTTTKGPDFIIAGCAKSGTTALWHWLNAHPDVFLPSIKEPGHFAFAGRDPTPKAGPFDPAYVAQIIPDWADYTALFDDAAGRLKGEASPIYAIEPDAPHQIFARRPDVKIILLLRAPVARAFSQFAHHVRDGLDPAPDFSAALKAEHTRLEAGYSPFFGYASGSFYRPVLERFWAVFPPDQVLVVFHEDMEADPQGTYATICRFLGLREDVQIDGTRRDNVASASAKGARFAALRRLLRHPPAPLRLAARLLPSGLRARVKRGLVSLNTSAPVRLDPRVAKTTAARFEGDVTWLEHQFRRDLSHWRQ